MIQCVCDNIIAPLVYDIDVTILFYHKPGKLSMLLMTAGAFFLQKNAQFPRLSLFWYPIAKNAAERLKKPK